MKHIIYKIDIIETSEYYIGYHGTNNIHDSYMGSGGNKFKLAIKNAKSKEYTIIKSILYVYDNIEHALLKEKELVTHETISDSLCLNSYIGGGTYISSGTTVVRDKHDNTFVVSVNDDRYKSRELLPVSAGFSPAFDNLGNKIYVSTSDPRWKTGDITGRQIGSTLKHKITGEFKYILNNDIKNYPDYENIQSNKVTVKDKHNNTLSVSTTDKRYLSGELLPINKNMVVMKCIITGKSIRVSKDDYRIKCGKLVGISKGMKYLHNITLRKNKCVNIGDIEMYLSQGWVLGKKSFKELNNE